MMNAIAWLLLIALVAVVLVALFTPFGREKVGQFLDNYDTGETTEVIDETYEYAELAELGLLAIVDEYNKNVAIYNDTTDSAVCEEKLANYLAKERANELATMYNDYALEFKDIFGAGEGDIPATLPESLEVIE